MPIKTLRIMIVLFGTVVVFGRMCTAGTWIDDFSDPDLRDWGGDIIDDEVSAIVVGGHFYYRGKNERALYDMENRGLGKSKIFRSS